MYPGEHEVGIHCLIMEKHIVGIDWDWFTSKTGQDCHHTAWLKALEDRHSSGGATSNHIKEDLGLKLSSQSLIVLIKGGRVLKEHVLHTILFFE